MKKKHIGSSFDRYLREEGIDREVTAAAAKRVRARRASAKKKASAVLTRDFRKTVVARAAQDPKFRKALKRETLRAKIEARIARRQAESVFLPREFHDLGNEDQVLRVLRGMVREKRLVRLGYGVYGRAIVSRLSGEPLLYSPTGFLGAAQQALTKLGVKWEPSKAQRDYNEGRSTQVPVNPVVRVSGRFSRRLWNGHLELVIER
jgi:hypothetical protein